jgi:predicted GTPase
VFTAICPASPSHAPEYNDSAVAACAQVADSERIKRVADIADALGAIRLRNEARAFAERIAAARVYVACVGQFKRGKSSLLNALVGQSLLPTGLMPVTAIPTTLRYGAKSRLRVQFTSGDEREYEIEAIADFVTENGNPENVRNVNAVEVFVPSELLEPGLCLVDTPGLGSIFRGAEARTRRTVPRIDAAIAVIGADPPLSGEELDLIADASEHIGELIVVLNKADRFDDDARRVAREFAEQAISRRLGMPARSILEVSATERLANTGPVRDWEELIVRLNNLATARRDDLVRSAHARGARRIVEECLVEIAEMSHAIYRPVAETEARLERLQDNVAHAAFDGLNLNFAIEQERRAVRHHFAERQSEYLADTAERISYRVARSVEYAEATPKTTLRNYALGLAREAARRELMDWLEVEAKGISTRDEVFASRLVNRANDALAWLARQNFGSEAQESAPFPPAPVIAPPAMEPLRTPDQMIEEILVKRDGQREVSVRTKAGKVWRRSLERRMRSGFAATRDVCSSRRALNRRIAVDVRREIHDLLSAGVGHIRQIALSRIDAIGSAVEEQVRDVRDSTYERADRAMAAARLTRERGAEAAYQEINRLAAWRREVVALLEADSRQSSTLRG